MTRFIVLSVLFVTVTACGDGSAPRPADTPATAQIEPVESASPRRSPLASALALGIEAPQLADGTYRVDPFVAAYTYFTITEGDGASWWTAIPAGDPTSGYRIEGTPDPALLDGLGLRLGDVIEELNGVPLTSPTAVTSGLRSAAHEVRLTIHRDGTSFTNSYRLFGGLAWQRVLEHALEAAPSPPPVPGTPVDAPPPAATPPDAPPPATTPPSPRPSTRAPTPPPTTPTATPRRPSTPAPRPSTRPASPAPETTPPATTPKSSGAQCSTAARCTIPKAQFDRLVADPHHVLGQMQVAPAIRNDVFSGYWIRGLRPGSLAGDLGFRAGDKITHVNGHALSDDTQAMALYFSLPTTRSFSIRYERNGTPLTKSVRVQ